MAQGKMTDGNKELHQKLQGEIKDHFLATSGVFYGWWVLLALALLRVMASGVGNNVRSLLVLPLEEEFGATRAQISLMATAGSLAIALTGPLGGWLMDRYGPRRVMFVSLVFAIAGYILLASAQALWQVIIIFTIPLGVAYNWAILNSGAPILNNWFDRGKARALSLLNVGHGAGALMLPFMAIAITEFGWRTAMIIGAGAMMVVGFPVVWVARNTPEEMGLAPDGDPPVGTTDTSVIPAAQSGSTLAQAVRGLFFWSVGIGSACMLFVSSSITFHLVPLMVWKGESESFGAILLSMQLTWTVPVVLGVSWAADRFDGTRIMTAMMTMVLLGVVVMLFAQEIWGYLLAVAMLAFGGSHWAILWATLGRQYGRAHYNIIRLSIYSILIAGMSGAPYFAGLSFDRTNSYDPWLRILLFVGILGALSFVVAAFTRSGSGKQGEV
ncbi:MAG: MFS transporter [Chloroflexota bacterium]|nr:MFS transporter [Chloroflexota bacterium]